MARSLFKLSRVLAALNDPMAEEKRQEAYQLRADVIGGPSQEDSEEEGFDELVAYT